MNLLSSTTNRVHLQILLLKVNATRSVVTILQHRTYSAFNYLGATIKSHGGAKLAWGTNKNLSL